MKEAIPYKISYFKLPTCKKKFILGDILIVWNPDFSAPNGNMIADIFDKLHIKDLEYEYFIDYNEALVTIYFGTLI